MNLDKAIRLASKWSDGNVCSLREGEAMAYHELCLEALQRMRREQETVTICHHLEPVTIYRTNADHIRSMTDEELAFALKILAKNDVCLNPQSDDCDGCVFHPFCNSVRCEEDVADWLKQPYEEDL